MTTIKTDDLTPAQINALVAVAEGWVPHTDAFVDELRKIMVDTPPVRKALKGMDLIWLPKRDLDARWRYGPPDFCGDWRLAGPVVENGRYMKVSIEDTGITPETRWEAILVHKTASVHIGVGATHLIALMRAHVQSNYGDTITTADKPWLLEAAAS